VVNAVTNKRVLGVDLGLRRTGLAVSDELGISVRALDNLTPKSRANDIEYLMKLCQELGVAHIVIGYAMREEKEGPAPMAIRASRFSEALQIEIKKRQLSLKVHLIDESYSSKLAAKRLVLSDIPKKRRKEALDSEVARILVEDFLFYEQV